jgi:hypothetical protein
LSNALLLYPCRRGAFAADGEQQADDDDDEDGHAPAAAAAATPAAAAAADDVLTPAQTAKKARIGAMWEQLQVATTGSVGKLSRNTISLASLCSNTDPKKKRNTDLVSCSGSSSRSCKERIVAASLLAVRVYHAVPPAWWELQEAHRDVTCLCCMQLLKWQSLQISHQLHSWFTELLACAALPQSSSTPASRNTLWSQHVYSA